MHAVFFSSNSTPLSSACLRCTPAQSGCLSQSALLFSEKTLCHTVRIDFHQHYRLRSAAFCPFPFDLRDYFKIFSGLFQRTFYHKLISVIFVHFIQISRLRRKQFPLLRRRIFFHPKKDFLCFSSRRAFLFISKIPSRMIFVKGGYPARFRIISSLL